MLFQRYSDPFTLVNNMIRSRRLNEFVIQFMKLRNQDVEEKTVWEMWLHKVFDMTFAEFNSSLNRTEEPEQQTDEELADIVRNSWNMLDNFVID